ncbi:Polynucleotidyl transferase, ribonuclease H-like superfamily protein [Thalictrum thalictroides]|uniref:Polynucleotidyl transferase, ribonuclease H-like superfamily protein n=1 Tax=Thalictrum thalictroides TaxID=46969 RepID=A0A7J6UYN2_THATH|nr:Polynucleotidyl transferase, ribonuclease H-like superfamily protein [Thalictrum thalictroides]
MEDEKNENRTISLHTFSDMSRVSPTVFIYLLKESYVYGTQKATTKFRALQQQVLQILQNSPRPGPATFVVQCLYVLPLLGELYTEGFGHLILSSFRRLHNAQVDLSEAQSLAAQLVADIIGGDVIYGVPLLIKMLEAFDIRMTNIQKAISRREESDGNLEMAKAFIEAFISRLIQSESYTTAVTLMEHFSIHQPGQSFLEKMMQQNQFSAAEKWATFMGKAMLCAAVQKYIDMKLLRKAYKLIKANDLEQDFSEAYHMCKESALKRLAEKGCWDVAEFKTHGNKQLLEYLVYLAMEAGYTEKVDELCERYTLTGFVNIEESKVAPPKTRYLNIHELVAEDIIWVDDVDVLLNATSRIEASKVIGVDCEWKPNYIKGSKPNKVSIMQIASEKTAFIIDLLTLSVAEPVVLDNCLKRILHSPSILKLGYNLQCDLKQLSHSYEKMECFKHYEMLLDIQNVFKEPKGGLSGLSEKILGAGLNKTRRNSNWEQRPLSQNQVCNLLPYFLLIL